MSSIVEALSVTLGADVSEFKKGFKQAQESSESLTEKVRLTGESINRVGSFMMSTSGLAVAGLAAMNDGFDEQTKRVAKTVGAIQGLVLATGMMMQGYASAQKAIDAFRLSQEKTITVTGKSQNSMLGLASAAGTVAASLTAAAAVGWTIGTALDRTLGISEQFNDETMFRVAPSQEELDRLERLGKVSEDVYLKMARTREHAVKLLMDFKGYTSEQAHAAARPLFAAQDALVQALVRTGRYSEEQAKKAVEQWGDAARAMVKAIDTAHRQAMIDASAAAAFYRAAAAASLQQFHAALTDYRRARMTNRSEEDLLTDWYTAEWDKRKAAFDVEMSRWEQRYREGAAARGATEESVSIAIALEYDKRYKALNEALAAEVGARDDAIQKHKKLIADETEMVRSSLAAQVSAYREAAEQRVAQMRTAYSEIARLEQSLAAMADKRRDVKDRLEEARFGVDKRGLSEEEAYQAEQDRAYELLEKAKRAQEMGQHELARQYTGRAMQMFQSLVREIKDADGLILLSLEQTIADAQAGLDAVERTYEAIAAAEEASLVSQIERQKQLIDELRQELESLFTDMNRTITISLETTEAKAALADLQKQLDEFIAKMQGAAADAGQQGAAPAKHAYGGWVGGNRVGDSTPALLTPGEFVVNADSAKTYAPMLDAMNSMKAPISSGSGGSATVNIQVSEALTREYIRDVLAPEINRSISRQRIRSFN